MMPKESAKRSDSAREPDVLTVAELTLRIKDSLESAFPALWVTGELSDIARPRSGHIYFTLKDPEAQIRGVIWRSTASRLPFELEDGTEVVCGGSIDVYPPRGSYQLVVRQIEPRGVGSLQLALRQLQQRLAKEGLFDAERKRPLPRFPRRIALVTSPTGAAIRDFLEVMRRRWQGAEVIVIPVRVQGAGAASEIANGIATANQLRERPDVVVVGRGGGSVEDLWCFNEEVVVRSIFQSTVPVVSAVGHEIDVTLSDLVADVRALTPSEAAELVVPSSAELASVVANLRQRLIGSLKTRARQARLRLDGLQQSRALRHPLDRVRELSRRVDELEMRAARSIKVQQTKSNDRVAHVAARLESLSPLAVLGRGYSLTHRTSDGEIIRSAKNLEIGESITSRLQHGSVTSRVESVDGAG